jgi:hypothetical protein
VDEQGNVYVASHALADVDLRKYSPTGSLLYATGAFQVRISQPGAMRGFVMLVDTAKPASDLPLYVTYLADAEAQVAAIRTDAAGNAYLAGTTESVEFPHSALLRVVENATPSGSAKRIGFVSVLDSAGSHLLWSTLLQDSELTALTLDEIGNVFATGRVRSPCASGIELTGCDDVLVVKLTDRGQRLSFVAQFGGARDDKGIGISRSADGDWLFIAADSDSADFPATSKTNTLPTSELRSYFMALQPCRTAVCIDAS